MSNFKLLKNIAIALGVVVFAACIYLSISNHEIKKQDVFFRFNQLNYAANQPFEVLVLTKNSNVMDEVLLLNRDLQKVTELKWVEVGRLNEYFQFKISLPPQTQGTYYISFQQNISEPFLVSPVDSQKIVEATLEFFRFQRCGSAKNFKDQLCHQANKDVSGGWHDAGDYIRFVLTTSFATTLILNSAQFLKNPQLVNKALEEAEWGLLWLDKMWSQKNHLLYQVGDVSDHDRWRLPWDDDRDRGPMKTYELPKNEGANLAGRIVASFALYASSISDPQKSQYWKSRAEQIYHWAQDMQRSSSSTDHFYKEEQWQDDMALAALELYHLTQQQKYLNEALNFLKRAKNPYTFDYANLHILSFFKLAFYEKSQTAFAKQQIRNIITSSVESHKKNQWGVALDQFFWGSHMHICGMAMGGILLDRLELNNEHQSFYLSQWNYLLGSNPWGVSFVAPIGHFPKSPHHQMVDLDKKSLPAFWGPGPIPRSEWATQKITLSRKDPFVDFQSAEAVYHDDKNDYITNEPTLTMSATGLFLSVLMQLNQPN